MRARIHARGRQRLYAGTVAALVAVAAASLALLGHDAEGSPTSPLAAYPGFGHDPAGDEARFANEERTRENLVAACMKRKGFPYSPSPSIVVDDGLSRRQVKRLVDADPNNRHLASLRPAAYRAYSLALAGVPDANEPSGPIGGCLGEAARAVPGVYAAYGALLEPFERLQAEIASDPRVVAAERRWAECMRGRGFAYAGPRDLAAAHDGSPTPPPAAAASGRACEERAALRAALAEARHVHEARFVDRHREVLERFGR
jgi:hypothetical protein